MTCFMRSLEREREKGGRRRSEALNRRSTQGLSRLSLEFTRLLELELLIVGSGSIKRCVELYCSLFDTIA